MSSDTPDPGDAVLAAIHARRSVGRVASDPLPRALVAELLDAAVQAPNHHATAPWRFLVLAGAARAEVWERMERAPVVVACVVAVSDDPVTAREDRDATAAAVMNLLIAAQARGLHAMWRTGDIADDPGARTALDLGPREAVVAFVYLGRPAGVPPPRPPRPGAEAVTQWRGW